MFENKLPDLRDVHGLSDGGVAIANQQEPVLQSVFSNHHREQHAHLVIPTTWHQRRVTDTQCTCSGVKVDAVETLNKFSLGVQFVHGGLRGVHVSRPCADSHF